MALVVWGVRRVMAPAAPAAFVQDLFVAQGAAHPAAAAEAAIRPLLERIQGGRLPAAAIAIDYPPQGALFPPEIVAPTILWHDPSTGVTNWLIEISFTATPHRIYVLCNGTRPAPVIDPECVMPRHAEARDAYAESAHGWTPDPRVWEIVKAHSVGAGASVTVRGVESEGPRAVSGNALVSSGSVSFATSHDPVGAPIFYRDVPLMPSETEKGIVKPLADNAVTKIKWRLRDISKPAAPVVMQEMPTCINCHSFARDGSALSTDVDGPDGDKGAHAVKAIAKHMSIETQDVFTWNDYQHDPAHMSFGMFPRISPDGRYVAATIKESVFVQNYKDFRFLQTFYPTRGILAIYDRQERKIRPLPGADSQEYVQTNPVWSPDGSELVFLRASARDNYDPGKHATYANDPNEPRIQFDLYRIPFNGGRGGTAVPVAGASRNGKSNSFPKFSPDGKWIVYVQAANGLLMRPDSRLFMIPSQGGRAREMTCNTRLMNSWHDWSPNGHWLVFSSKSMRPFTQMFLTHVDENGNDTPAVLLPNSTADNRAVNLPEFVNIAGDGIEQITSPAADYRRHMAKGAKLAEEGKLDAAYNELEQSIAQKPDYPANRVGMALILNGMGRHEQAVHFCQEALALDAGAYEAHFQWGNALYAMGRTAEAVQQYVRSLDINPAFALARNNLGAALVSGDRPERAEQEFRAAIDADKSYAAPHYNWGNALLKLGRTDEAVERFRKAIELKPDYTDALEALAKVLIQQGKNAEAIDCYRKAAASDPTRESAQYGLATLCVRSGAIEESVKHFQATARINPQNHQAETDLGSALISLGRSEEAIAHFRKALNIEPGNDQARNNLAWILATHSRANVRDGHEAVTLAELACRNTRWQNARFMLTLATAYAEAGRFADAVRTGKTAVTLAESAGDKQLASGIRGVLRLYEQGKTFAQGQ